LDEEHGISTLFDLRGYLEPAFLCWLWSNVYLATQLLVEENDLGTFQSL
jgi:hypothetical protein